MLAMVADGEMVASRPVYSARWWNVERLRIAQKETPQNSWRALRGL